MSRLFMVLTVCAVVHPPGRVWGQSNWRIDDPTLASYFRMETQELQDRCLSEIQSKEDWEQMRGEYRRQLQEMLGLDPFPERTPLHPVITGTVEHDDFLVDNLQFQSLPGLYVTANFYRPKQVTEKLPTILYVCGHARVAKDDVSIGNKAAYQHHGAWFARHGYTCLTIDTVQLGEIEGIHHGTYRYGMWWWNSRGYTPAGVEAWNCIRALDYLETRPEVDAARFGVTGRSGGGAYSWWSAALDDRIKVAVPVAGITSLKNHVVDGCVEGHCDCMFMVNTYRWDYAQVAALVAPRPLLISNTDKDSIFPLDGVVQVHQQVRRIYDLLGADGKLGLQITEGPHKDTQELHIHAFVWFDRWLKGGAVPISKPAEKFFEPEQLKVFAQIPADERVTTIHDTFVPVASGETPSRAELIHQLREKSFRGWPGESEAQPLDVRHLTTRNESDCRITEYEYSSDSAFRLKFYVVQSLPLDTAAARLLVRIPNPAEWQEGVPGWLIGRTNSPPEALKELGQELQRTGAIAAYIAPRGTGDDDWSQTKTLDDGTVRPAADARKLVQIRRRFMLLGQTLDGMRVYDVRRALLALQAIPEIEGLDTQLQAHGSAAVWALFAALFEPRVDELALRSIPLDYHEAPDFLNVARIADLNHVLDAVRKTADVSVDADSSSASGN